MLVFFFVLNLWFMAPTTEFFLILFNRIHSYVVFLEGEGGGI